MKEASHANNELWRDQIQAMHSGKYEYESL